MRFFNVKPRVSMHGLHTLWLFVPLATLTIFGCKKDPSAHDGAENQDASSDLNAISGTVDAGIALAGADQSAGQADALGTEPISNITIEGEEQIAHGIGSAPVGHDISLARDAAANRAQANLLKLLKENGFETQSPGVLKGATIRRFWKQGRSIYAEAVVSLGNTPQKMNQPPPASSNPAEGKPSEKNVSTKGGMEP